MHVDLVFPVIGSHVATDHAYHLYSALSGIVPAFHAEDKSFRFAPVTGVGVDGGRIRLGPSSCITIRLPSDSLRIALPLAGRKLTIGDAEIRLGAPAVRTLKPAPVLVSRIVTFKNADTPDEFLATTRVKIAEVIASGEPQLPLHVEGPRAGEPKRRVVRIKGVAIVGYSLLVSELTAADSLALQERGLGGRTHLGCGFFMPAKGGV